MNVTRRYWEVVGLVLVLVGGAVLLSRPVLLAGGALLGAWLLARQYAYVQALVRLDESLSVTQSISQSVVIADDETVLELEAVLDEPTPLVMTVTAAPPIGARLESDERPRIQLGVLDRAATSAPLAWPIVGSFQFGPATVTARDRFGLFAETIRTGTAPSVVVEPRRPRTVHVGTGGKQVTSAYGEHPTERAGSGLTPAEVREYTAGDSAGRIDWKATARLGTPHVREYEAETDRVTALVLDHRASMATGRSGETTLDYLREVALSLLATARDVQDPVGLYTVGDAGLTDYRTPSSNPAQYNALRTALLDVRPTEPAAVPAPDGPAASSPARSRRLAHRLDADESTLATRLRPFLSARDPYRHRIERDPLFAVIRLVDSRSPNSRLTVILTDDANRTELREAVKLARRGDGGVVCFLAPQVLYEPGGLADLAAAYGRYTSFETFRRALDRLDRVSAFEVAPGDRLAAVLAAGRARREVAP